MLLLVLENSRTTALFYTKTIETYEARIMSELFHAEFLQNEMADQGSRLYNVGKLTYERQGQLLQIECHVKSRRFTFTFLLPEEQEKDGCFDHPFSYRNRKRMFTASQIILNESD